MQEWCLKWEREHGNIQCQQREQRSQFADAIEKHDAAAVLELITQRQATFTARELDRALRRDMLPEAAAAFAAEILALPAVVRLYDRQTGEYFNRFTTETVRAAELAALGHAGDLAKITSHQAKAAARVLAAYPTMSDEQRRAFEHCTKAGGLALIVGRAGTGKSYTMAAIRDAYDAEGYRVLGLAPTNKVARGLASSGFDEARTIHSALFALKRGKDAWDEKTVVMVDEAAMIGTRLLSELLEQAAKVGAKVVLVGDDRQLASIERGGLFTELRERFGCAEITEVRRQRDDDHKAAAEMLSRGEFADALAKLDVKGCIHRENHMDEARAALVRKWAEDTAAKPDASRFVFTYTNADVDTLNRDLRAVRKERGELGEDHAFTTKHGKADFAANDRVVFTTTNRKAGLTNGEFGTIEKISGRFITVRTDDGKKIITFDAEKIDGFRHGYAGTIYKGQGETLDNAYLFHSQHWRSAASYVALTRHRDNLHLFVSTEVTRDTAELAEQMARRDDRRASLAFALSAEAEETRRVQYEAAAAKFGQAAVFDARDYLDARRSAFVLQVKAAEAAGVEFNEAAQLGDVKAARARADAAAAHLADHATAADALKFWIDRATDPNDQKPRRLVSIEDVQTQAARHSARALAATWREAFTQAERDEAAAGILARLDTERQAERKPMLAALISGEEKPEWGALQTAANRHVIALAPPAEREALAAARDYLDSRRAVLAAQAQTAEARGIDFKEAGREAEIRAGHARADAAAARLVEQAGAGEALKLWTDRDEAERARRAEATEQAEPKARHVVGMEDAQAAAARHTARELATTWRGAEQQAARDEAAAAILARIDAERKAERHPMAAALIGNGEEKPEWGGLQTAARRHVIASSPLEQREALAAARDYLDSRRDAFAAQSQAAKAAGIDFKEAGRAAEIRAAHARADEAAARLVERDGAGEALKFWTDRDEAERTRRAEATQQTAEQAEQKARHVVGIEDAQAAAARHTARELAEQAAAAQLVDAWRTADDQATKDEAAAYILGNDLAASLIRDEVTEQGGLELWKAAERHEARELAELVKQLDQDIADHQQAKADRLADSAAKIEDKESQFEKAAQDITCRKAEDDSQKPPPDHTPAPDEPRSHDEPTRSDDITSQKPDHATHGEAEQQAAPETQPQAAAVQIDAPTTPEAAAPEIDAKATERAEERPEQREATQAPAEAENAPTAPPEAAPPAPEAEAEAEQQPAPEAEQQTEAEAAAPEIDAKATERAEERPEQREATQAPAEAENAPTAPPEAAPPAPEAEAQPKPPAFHEAARDATSRKADEQRQAEPEARPQPAAAQIDAPTTQEARPAAKVDTAPTTTSQTAPTIAPQSSAFQQTGVYGLGGAASNVGDALFKGAVKALDGVLDFFVGATEKKPVSPAEIADKQARAEEARLDRIRQTYEALQREQERQAEAERGEGYEIGRTRKR